jgi:hypothetical protein
MDALAEHETSRRVRSTTRIDAFSRRLRDRATVDAAWKRAETML